MTLKYAKQHLAIHPIETGPPNSGPWVRLYMNGNEGEDWLWCAGFVTTMLRSACAALGTAMPIKLVKVGDEVLYGKYSGSDVEVDGKDLKILRESDLLAKVG